MAHNPNKQARAANGRFSGKIADAVMPELGDDAAERVAAVFKVPAAKAAGRRPSEIVGPGDMIVVRLSRRGKPGDVVIFSDEDEYGAMRAIVVALLVTLLAAAGLYVIGVAFGFFA